MLIKEKLLEQSHLTDIDRSVATYILENPEKVRQLSARKIAGELFVAPSTISRFCKKMGYQGYTDFRAAYLEEYGYLESHFNEIDPNLPFTGRDSAWTVTNKIGQLYKETVSDTLSLLDYRALEKTIELFTRSRTIYMFMLSIGDHFDLIKNFRNKMLRIGEQVQITGRSDLAFYQASNAAPEDCFVLISYSGETKDLLRVLSKLKSRKVPLVAITSYGENTLSVNADITLNLSTREKLIANIGHFSSDLSVMFILDSLYAIYFSKNFEANYRKKRENSQAFQIYRRSENPLLNWQIAETVLRDQDVKDV